MPLNKETKTWIIYIYRHIPIASLDFDYTIGLISRVFTNGLGARVLPRTQKTVLDAALLSTQHYKVRIKGKVEQSRE